MKIHFCPLIHLPFVLGILPIHHSSRSLSLPSIFAGWQTTLCIPPSANCWPLHNPSFLSWRRYATDLSPIFFVYFHNSWQSERILGFPTKILAQFYFHRLCWIRSDVLATDRLIVIFFKQVFIEEGCGVYVNWKRTKNISRLLMIFSNGFICFPYFVAIDWIRFDFE